MKTTIDFVKFFKPAFAISALLVVGTIVLFFNQGLNYGVDFRGGVEVQVRFRETVDQGQLRSTLNERNIPLAQLQTIGAPEQNEFLLKLLTDESAQTMQKAVQTAERAENKDSLNELSNRVETVLGEVYGANSFEIMKTDIVGPKAGAELRNSAFQALGWAILAIMIYLALRFDYKFAPGAIAALIHDSVIIIGVFILTQREFTLQIVAALLAVIGYSVNDTVVIYDRVREIENQHSGASTIQVINRAINETMARTLNTSLTVLAVTVIMLIWGGPVIHDFFFAMTIGVLLGVYSTIFIAVPMTVVCEKLMKKQLA
jgi:preprotein translocase subunit SecF